MKASNTSRMSRSAALGLALALGMATLATGCASVDQGVAGSTEPAQDTWITTKVKTNLATLKDMGSSDISVETNNGVVTLSGHVESAEQRGRAVSSARNIEGVKDVDTSMLSVTGQ